MILVIQIVGILFMLTLMSVGIWTFIIMNQILGQMRYKNYLLEKLNQHIYMMASKKDKENVEATK